MFWSKKVADTKHVFRVPDEHVAEILKLSDIYDSKPVGQRRESAYVLFKKIREVFPNMPYRGVNVTFPSPEVIEITYITN